MREAKYDSVIFPAARKLMNTSTAPQALDRDSAQAVVNLLPTKGGTLAIRHGTIAVGSPTGDGNIIEIMPFVKGDGTQQILVYTDGGKIKLYDSGLGTYSDVRTGLDTDGYPVFDYMNEGGTPKMVIVNGIDPNMIWDGTSITTMKEFVEDIGASKTWVSATQASINVGTLGAANYPNTTPVRLTISTAAHLNLTSITRSGSTATVTTTVASNLVTGDYVTISGATQPEYNGTFQITVTGASTFTYTVTGTPATPATGAPILTFAGLVRTTTVSSTSLSGQVLTITFGTSVMPAASVTITKMEFEKAPEPFSFIFTAQNRLWAIPAGETLPTTFKNNSKRGYIYYTTSLNVINSWFSPTTMEQAFFDISNTMPTADEIIAIGEYLEFMVFVGRTTTQVWRGSNPSDANNWEFAQSYNVGAVAPKLVQKLPNDLAMVSQYGLINLKIVIANETVEANTDLGSAVDVTMFEESKKVLSSTANYRQAKSFYYPRQGIFGFKMVDKTLVLKISEEARGWVEWTGDFQLSTAFGVPQDEGALYLADGQQLMQYADGAKNTIEAYSDRGQAIRWTWWTPWVGGTRRWANHAFEVIHNDSAQITFEVVRLKDNSLGFQSANSLTTAEPMGFWDESFWDAASWDSSTTPIPKIRDKFIAQTMSFVVRGLTTDGPFEIVSLMCFGQWER